LPPDGKSEAMTATPSSSADEGQIGETLRTAMRDCQDEILGMLYYLLGDADDAYDAFQETFQRGWRRGEALTGATNLRGWLFRIAFEVGRDRRSAVWRRRHHRNLPADEDRTTSTDAVTEEQIARQRRLAQLRRVLLQLRCEEQEVFLLRQNGQMTYEEIAQVTKAPVGTIQLRMRLALGKLREALDHDA
jgi:RNA polymerase sigma-70 factor (ECF subfamily)